MPKDREKTDKLVRIRYDVVSLLLVVVGAGRAVPGRHHHRNALNN
jgi:hypothetical protein